jgi:hypothetical protein
MSTQAPTFSRHIFRTSRLAEFCSRKELTNQTGHAIEDWPIVALKELLDNALDACEESGIAPVIDITVSRDGIAISDNGPGLGAEVVADILDYTARVSSREAYASPTRGAQGNALKTILAMPFVLDGQKGETIIESREVAHRIGFSIDRIRQVPRITRTCEVSLVKTGIKITVTWPDSASSTLDSARARFLQIVEDYTWINPHLSLTVDWNRIGGQIRQTFGGSGLSWHKWRPCDPTAPHWYDDGRFGRLVAAHIAHAQDHNLACPTVREFVSEFRGLSGTAKVKAICEVVGASRLSLSEFYGDGTNARIGALLAEMRKASRPTKPKDLGVIGRDHLAAKFASVGAALETFDYRRAEFEHDGLPYFAEVAFGYCPHGFDERRIITGINWSPSIGADPFRCLGPDGESLGSILTRQRAGRNEPIVTVLHLACPRIDYLDRGKSSVAIPQAPAKVLISLAEGVTAKWARQRRAEERDANARARREDRLVHYHRPVSLRDAAFRGMRSAYLKASANGTLPANARQIYYAARPAILEIADRDSLDAQYFCQNLLIDYMQTYDIDWDVVWDDRGHFIEPHTGRVIGLGTLSVRKYLRGNRAPEFIEAGFAHATIKTHGPEECFGALLFIEKEGFMPLFEAAHLAEKYDLGIMSSKGMSVTAARQLADQICSRYKVPLLILRDFDISGFSISRTVGTNTRRYIFQNQIKVIDLGVRLADVEEMGLESEIVSLGNVSRDKIRERLRRNGATDDEIKFLLRGERVELIAMASDVFIAFVERKLAEHEFAKVIPAIDQLERAFCLFARGERIRQSIEDTIKGLAAEEISVPTDLDCRVRAYLAENPEQPWSAAVRHIVNAVGRAR